MSDGLKPCPFCGIPPNTFYTFTGTVAGYPALVANIQCPACKIQMSWDVPYKEDKDSAERDYGQTPFEYATIATGELADKWNKRINE